MGTVAMTGSPDLRLIYHPFVSDLAHMLRSAGRSLVTGNRMGADAFVRVSGPCTVVRSNGQRPRDTVFSTREIVRYACQGGDGSALVAIFSKPNSSDALLACRFALREGLPVVAIPCGFDAEQLPQLNKNGRWVACAEKGPWATSHKWDNGGLFSTST